MHAREGADHSVINPEVEETSEDRSLGQYCHRDESQSYSHPDAQPNHRVSVRAHSRAQKRQQRERTKKARGDAQRIVRPQIDIIRSALWSGQCKPESGAQKIADEAEYECRSGEAFETK